MRKELEDLINFISTLLNARLSDKHFINVANNETWLELSKIKLALLELQSIDNANPSEALEWLEQFLNEMTYCLEHPKEYTKGYEKQIFWKYKNTLETTVKQALIKAQEPKQYVDELKLIEKSLKAFEIIKEKRVACDLLTNPDVMDYKKYNSHCDKYDFIVPLTEEEFGLLKEMLE